MFKSTLSVGGNRLFIPEAPPEGSGGASGESGTRITPTLALTYQVEPARTFFAPSRVRFRVEGMVDGTTYAKQYNLPGQPPETNLCEVQWDGTDNLGNRVPDGDYTVRASVYSKVDAEEPRYKHESAEHTITVDTNTRPVASITVVTEAVDFGVGETIKFDAKESHDPDDFTASAPYNPDDYDVNAPNNGITYYAWNFGEGATPQTLSGTTASTASCTYSSVGEKTVTLTVLDNDGEQGQQVDPAKNPKAVLASTGVAIGGNGDSHSWQ